MYILNHSCKAENSVADTFIDWINEFYGEKDSYGNNIYDYRYSRLLEPTEDDGTQVIIIQLFLNEVFGAYDMFLVEQQEKFQKALFERFQTKVLSFLTLMKVLPKNE